MRNGIMVSPGHLSLVRAAAFSCHPTVTLTYERPTRRAAVQSLHLALDGSAEIAAARLCRYFSRGAGEMRLPPHVPPPPGDGGLPRVGLIALGYDGSDVALLGRRFSASTVAISKTT